MTHAKPQLEWTGERMIPFQSDAATELYHWQRYLFFKPWYQDARVADAACGEGYGVNFASVYAQSATGFDVDAETVAYGNERYPGVKFKVGDVCNVDYSDFDLVTSFETIEHVPDPEAFLRALRSCDGRIVISTPNRKTHSPGNRLQDKPLNPFHTIEWTPNEFAELVKSIFPDRQVRFLSQELRWPGRIVEGLDDEAMYCIAVIGDGDLPAWPKIGMSIPTCNNFGQLQETILGFSRYYPGSIEFAVTANGTDGEHLSNLKKLESAMPYMLKVIEPGENLGYGRGCNTGLDYLWQESWFDYFAVANDDVLPVPSTMIELVDAMRELQKMDEKVGVVAPVSNNIHGQQRVEIGEFGNKIELAEAAAVWHRAHHSSGTPHFQLRGLLLLITPDCLSEVGGFDPRFGMGNFEDDDFNLRCRLAGYSNWIADGSFLFHYGSQTFQNLKVDYSAAIERNAEIFRWKWDLMNLEDWPQLEEAPSGVSLFVPLSSTYEMEFPVKTENGTIDLISQASDMEFAAWVYERLKVRHRHVRRAVVSAILADSDAAEKAA
jgi:GT2 family glycosyltransferase